MTTAPVPLREPRRVPGEVGVWIVVVADIVAFAVMFGVFLVLRAEDPGLFATSRETLSIGFGVANTAVLLASSLAVVLALHATRVRRLDLADRAITAAIAFGFTFVLLKSVEWGVKIDDGLVPGLNDFYMMYFALTGMHLLHVAIGLLVLFLMRRLVRRGATGRHAPEFLESGAIFWHMVDMLWLILFAVVYLVA